MSLEPTGRETSAAFAGAVRSFVARECGSPEQRAQLTDHGREAHSSPICHKLGELGWAGVAFPERYGGSGGGVADACVLLEELAYGQVPVFGLGISMIVGRTALRFGTEQQRHEIIGSVSRGEVSAIAMSEPEAGSDVGAMRCAARHTGDGYVVDGQKTWISCAPYAERILLVCRTGATGRKHDGVTMLEVPRDTPGVEIRPIDTLGGREVNDVFFTGVEVSADRVIGVEHQAWRQLMAGLNFERLVCAATFLGNARRAFDDTLAYVSGRRQFGRPVGSFQALKHRLADLATELECCSLLVHDIARRTDDDPERQLPREASMAKLKATELAKAVTVEGMQMMGAAGYTTEYDMERQLRQNIVGTVFAGTSEIQRDIIGSSYGL
ncbi:MULTISPECIES: acyl-CoA dehydrogenase family protein [Pseudonocardia]|uniref:Acyl-CoA dehydrogenase n=2 Tax=Pseudonocardia TaxID=1847 RepID=A0A1Y2N4Q8_PSEAH|nr:MULTISPECIES: acyl-CoA dehydrogenase family protein [Pseudonocardia]OSY42119.1 Acyl-CoA dehydrogenase [Pseudonocardia autotrophica]TDN75113.1 alkylation response protein AidB-like acyl-CoA dehydrogenase [Pseudonocardia autotrophica]BBF99058.1 acyl-CoA dehydrogenase [Pseudonocardia autotrophica]GEC23978.1 acyl-CoA dehydrogenase [Pseudonocardia saturnea]